MSEASATGVAELLDQVRARLRDEFPTASEDLVNRCVDLARGFTTSEPLNAPAYAAAVERSATNELAVACAAPTRVIDLNAESAALPERAR